MQCAYSNFDTIKMFFHEQKPNADIHEQCILKRYVSCFKRRQRKGGLCNKTVAREINIGQ